MFVIITITFQYEYYYVNRIQQPTNICFVFFSVTSRKPSKGRNMVANNAGEEKIETNANGKMEIIYLMIIFARQFPRLFLSNKAIFIMPDPLRHNDVFHFTIHILTGISKDLYVKIMMPCHTRKVFFFAIHDYCEKDVLCSLINICISTQTSVCE